MCLVYHNNYFLTKRGTNMRKISRRRLYPNYLYSVLFAEFMCGTVSAGNGNYTHGLLVAGFIGFRKRSVVPENLLCLFKQHISVRKP